MSKLNQNTLSVNNKFTKLQAFFAYQAGKPLNVYDFIEQRISDLTRWFGKNKTVKYVLKHIIFWLNPNKNTKVFNGRPIFFDTIESITKVICEKFQWLCKKTVQRGVILLKNLGLITIHKNLHVNPGNQTNFYSINVERFEELLQVNFNDLVKKELEDYKAANPDVDLDSDLNNSVEIYHRDRISRSNILSKASYVSKAKALPKYNKKNTILSEESEKGAQPFGVASPFSPPQYKKSLLLKKKMTPDRKKETKSANQALKNNCEYRRNQSESGVKATNLHYDKESHANESFSLGGFFKSLSISK